jgi:hypothetical protein
MAIDRAVLATAVIAILAATPGPAIAQTGADKGQPSAASTLPEMPEIRPAPRAGFDDDAAFVRSIADRAADLADRAGRTADLTARVNLLLSSANLILAYELEPACTRKLLGIAAPSKADKAELSAALDRADNLIALADKTIREVTDANEKPDDRWQGLGRQQQALEAFAKALRAYLAPGLEPEAVRFIRRAASRLSVLLEDDNPRVVAAATLWQACLRGLETDLEPGLSILDPALANPRPQSLPYAFFGRLLRCRLVAAQGGYATALALLTQMEDLCDEWMSEDTDRGDALRAVSLLEIQILSEWHSRLSPTDHAAEREWCAERIALLRTERFGEGSETVLRLTEAIPILVSPPEADERTIDPSQDQG